MNLSVNWVDGMLMVGKSHSGHSITMDGPIEIGGENLGVRPMGNAFTWSGRMHYD